jgi:diguanylate cyclase (GGDEF)-like protein
MTKNRLQPEAMIGNDVIERIAYITSELDDIVGQTKNKTATKNHVAQIPTSLSMDAIFKCLVQKNISKGRMAFSTYLAGKEFGLSCQIKTKEELSKLAKRVGLGIIKYHSFTEEKVVIEIKNTFSSGGVKKAHQSLCYFEAGFLSGAVENIIGKKVDFKENHCDAQGKRDSCMFQMLQPGEEIKIEGVTIPLLKLKNYSAENVKMLTSLAAHSIAAIENALIFETTKKNALVDDLTGVFNHRFFQQTIRIEMSRSFRHGHPIALLMCDVDNFKTFNDKYSHMVGDEVLKKIAQVLLNSVRIVDYVTRYGGDEFAIILPQTNLEGALVVANRIISNAKKIKLSKDSKTLGVTVGVAANNPKNKMDSGDLLSKADQALMKAKATDSSLGFLK